MGISMQEDCVDPETGEIFPLVIVTDNGSAYKSDLFNRFIMSIPWLAHVRTRYRSPQTNGVIERFFGSLKYEHLYRREIPDGLALNDEVEAYRRLYNEIRPHESLDLHPPMGSYLAAPPPFSAERRTVEAADPASPLGVADTGAPAPEQ